MQTYRGLLAATCVLLAAASDCKTTMTPAQASAASGMAAFQVCDLRTASQAFESAHDLDPSRPDFALAYALSTLAVLAEDPGVSSLLERLGFAGPIDSSMLWGPGGILDQLSTRTATCQSISDYARAKLPYAAAQPNGPSAASIVKDPGLTGNDFVNAAAALSPRIQKIVDALDQGAGTMNGASLTGGCGVGTVYVQSPELYGLAGILEGFVAAVTVAKGYDWGVSATLALDTSGREQEFVDSLNAHLFHLTNAAAIESARPIAQHAVQLIQEGTAAVADVNSRPEKSMFNWADAPPNVVADIQTLATGVQTLLTTAGLQALPFISPSLVVDGRSFFDDPVDMTNVSPPIWSAVPWSDSLGDSGVNVESASTGVAPQLMARFSPYPFGDGAPDYSLMLTDRWQNVSSDTTTEVFDPDMRWENAFGCSN
jgi:hypothetical protein